MAVGGDFAARIEIAVDAAAAGAEFRAFVQRASADAQAAMAQLQTTGARALDFGAALAPLDAALTRIKAAYAANPALGAVPNVPIQLGGQYGSVSAASENPFQAIAGRGAIAAGKSAEAARAALETKSAEITAAYLASLEEQKVVQAQRVVTAEAAATIEAETVDLLTLEQASAKEYLTILLDRVAAATSSLQFELEFAADLAAGGGLAKALVDTNAAGVAIAQRRNAIMEAAVVEESRRLTLPLNTREDFLAAVGRNDRGESGLAPLVHEQDQAAAGTAQRAAEARQAEADATLALAEQDVIERDARLAWLDQLTIAFAEELAAQQEVAGVLRIEAIDRAAFNETFAAVKTRFLEEERVAHEEAMRAARLEAASRVATASVEAEMQAELLAGGAGGGGGGTRYQNFQSNLRGNDPLDNKTFGDQFGGGIARSAGFLVTTAVIFKMVAELRNALQEATKLDKEFSIIQSILDNVGQSTAFEGIRNQVLDLSAQTATAADVVANTERVLAGVFANDQGVPDFGRAATEAKVVLETAKVTGESVTKLEDQLTAISLSFAQNGIAPGFKDIVNYSLALEQSLGTSSAEILAFTATLAPLGRELGFDVQQLEGLGAVMAQVSGRPASALAEQLQRILAGLGQKLPKLSEILGSNDQTKDLLGPLGEAFGKGDTPEVLRILVENFSKLNQVQLDNLALLVGGRREAGTFFSLLAKAPETLRALNEGFKTTGSELDTRFQKVSESIGYSFENAKIQFQKFALEVLSSGLGDGIVHIADAFGVLFSILGHGVDIFQSFNDVMGGLPGQIGGVIFTILALVKALQVLLAVAQTVAATRIGTALVGGETAAAAIGGASIPSGVALLGGAGSFGAAQVSALSSGLLPGFASAAGVGGTGGLAAAAALPAALIAAFFPHTEIGGIGFGGYLSTQHSLAKAQASAEDRVLAQLQAGVPESQLRQSGDQGVAFGVSEHLGLHGDINEPLDRALKRFNQPGKTASLEALANRAGASEDSKKQLHELSQALINDPTNEFKNKIADTVLANANASQDPAVQEALRSVVASQNLDAKAKDAVAHINDAQNTQTIDDLQKAFDRGDIGSSAVNELLKGQLDNYNTVIEGLKRGGAAANDPNLIALESARDKYQKELDTNVRGTILNQQQFAQKLAQALGTGTDPNADFQRAVDVITSTTEQLRAARQLTATDLQNAYFGILQAQTAQRKALAAQATDPLERLRIEATPQEIPLEARRYLADAQLRDGSGAAAAEQFSKITGRGIEESRGIIVNIILAAGGDMAKVANEVTNLENSVSQAAATALRTAAAALKNIPNIGPALAAILTAKAAVLDAQGKIAGGSNESLFSKLANPTQTTPDQTALKDATRQRAQDIATAQIAVARALAAGDPQADAQLDLQLAGIEAAYAKTPVDKLNAQAHRIDALNKIKQANLALAKAQRDVQVAQGGDDPITAAKAALDNANDAVAAAQGPTAQALALAAQIRAQHNVAKTIQDLADAQLSVLLAMDNAAGDTVKAAKDAVAGLRAKLGNAGALGLSETDKANLTGQIIAGDAAVRDAQISSQEQAVQTALTLKRITKGQAIAMLQSIKSIPELNQKQIDQIDVEIANLRQQLGADFKLNLPNKLALPTLYEVRRLAQGGAGAYDRNVQGGNTVITNNVTVNAATNASPQVIANAVTDAIGDPRRNGTYAKRYGG